jgi:NifU-like protein involved in Fe-S cluster formation
MSIWELTDADKRSMLRAGYSKKALELYSTFEYRGNLGDANVCHTKKSSSGESLRLCIKADEDKVVASKYIHQGCPALAASAAAMVQLVLQKTIAEVESLDISDIWCSLNGLPHGHDEQVELCIETLKETVHILRNQNRLTAEQHLDYVHLCGATGKELDGMDIIPCPDCPLVQNCENDHVIG